MLRLPKGRTQCRRTRWQIDQRQAEFAVGAEPNQEIPQMQVSMGQTVPMQLARQPPQARARPRRKRDASTGKVPCSALNSRSRITWSSGAESAICA